MRTYSGSSPHARGTLGDVIQLAGGRRFIPAYAGNAALSALRRSWAAVHPCIRGERTVARKSSPPQAGSSPHARGTLEEAPDLLAPLRFIPAYAGNATSGTRTARATTVHPRMRGERTPRHPCDTHGHRFIPACAGNAAHHWPWPSFLPVHPRMRGERQLLPTVKPSATGSSPHARGTLVHIDLVGLQRRFIPACAGNATHGVCRNEAMPVHPRMRGERFTEMGCFTPRSGSSPHARGTPMLTWVAALLLRFIPACAGNALPVSY